MKRFFGAVFATPGTRTTGNAAQPPSFLDGTWKPPAVGRVAVTP